MSSREENLRLMDVHAYNHIDMFTTAKSSTRSCTIDSVRKKERKKRSAKVFHVESNMKKSIDRRKRREVVGNEKKKS